MISFQNFSFRYEESKDFTLRGIDMTVQTGEFILLTGRSGCGKTTLIRSLNGLIPHFYPGEIQGDLLMDGHSLLEMKPSELAGQLGTVFQDPRSQFFMTDTTRELAFGCENLGLPRKETIDRIAKAAKELELVDYLNRSIFALSSGEKQQIAIGSVYALVPKVYIFDEPSANLDYAATKRLAEIMGKLKHAGYTIFVVEHRFYYLRDLIDRAFLIQNGKIEHEFTREQFCSLPEETRISYGLRTAYPERDAEHYVSVPEQGGGKLIPDGMCNPGQVYTVSRGKSGMIGVFRLESQMLPGNGKIERTGLGSDSKCKEAVNTAFNYLKANGNRISGSISTSTKDYIINYQDLQGIGMTDKLALPTLIALCSIALGKPVVSNLAVLGDITISGTMIKVDELANTLQVCLDSGAKKVMIPSTSFVDFASVPADLMSAFQLIPYQSAEDAVFKALGVE